LCPARWIFDADFVFSIPAQNRNELLENTFAARLQQGGCFFARV
jgi:hypothetical protein